MTTRRATATSRPQFDSEPCGRSGAACSAGSSWSFSALRRIRLRSRGRPDAKAIHYHSGINERILLIRIQQKPFLENVISDADYAYFKRKLNNPAERYWYFVIRFLAATGARISELLQLKVEHVTAGHIDIYSKGGKMRRIYIPQKLKDEALSWLATRGQSSGFLFINRSGERITARGIAAQLKKLAIKYKLNPAVVYPHSFRHRFAKNFLEKFNDISLLADLMGHESIETTRIYLRRTSTEQRSIVDKVVTW